MAFALSSVVSRAFALLSQLYLAIPITNDLLFPLKSPQFSGEFRIMIRWQIGWQIGWQVWRRNSACRRHRDAPENVTAAQQQLRAW
ncbi:hypothetical protein [Anatilimnocola floriformis]|uniref:hypothetical protein n=1 Tax=Anatilimnocola floriformis TaxID=2948575 RepID=UPI0020C42871|nr:hypothetical protein [Anatilimnocola floriformis]